jgi:hypothetical protein
MFRPLKPVEIVFNEWPNSPKLKLIRKPKQKRKLKSWYSYYKWWLRCQVVERWVNIDCSMPFQRSKEFDLASWD